MQPDWPLRIVDNREQHLLFASTCHQKQIIA